MYIIEITFWCMQVIENAVILTWPKRTIGITNDTYIHKQQLSSVWDSGSP